MKLLLILIVISFPIYSSTQLIDTPIPTPAITRVSEAACIRSYSVKERVACMKLVDSSIIKAFWVGKMSQFCKSPFNGIAGKYIQCRNIFILSDALDEMGGKYVEE